MKGIIKKLLGLFFLVQGIPNFAQTYQTIDFENDTTIITSKGVVGKAFDLGNVSKRYAIAKSNPVKDSKSFTVMLWVKAQEDAQSAYTILSGLHKQEKGFDGWKFDMQTNGAWSFSIKGDEQAYTYNPTPLRQTIRDGEWHLLAVTHDHTQQRLAFYFDGIQKAIYNASGLGGVNLADSLVIGNSIDNEKPYQTEQWESFYGAIDDISCYTTALSSTEIQNLYEQIMGKEGVVATSEVTSLNVTSFNIWHGGNESGKEIGLKRTIELLKESKADVFTLVETYGSGEKIADALNYYLYLISSNLSIISRYPFSDTYPVYRSFNSGGAAIELPNGQHVNVFAIWLHYLPDYWSGFVKTERWEMADYMKEENKTRGKEIKAILSELKPFLEDSDNVPVIIAGDFNSGSHLDWTMETKELHNGYVIPWPASIAMEDNGLKDAWRVVYPDVLKYPGITWSPLEESYIYQKDRIDYIYYKGRMISPVDAKIIERHSVGFPSDHAGINAVFHIIDKK